MLVKWYSANFKNISLKETQHIAEKRVNAKKSPIF